MESSKAICEHERHVERAAKHRIWGGGADSRTENYGNPPILLRRCGEPTASHYYGVQLAELGPCVVPLPRTKMELVGTRCSGDANGSKGADKVRLLRGGVRSRARVTAANTPPNTPSSYLSVLDAEAAWFNA